MSLSPLDEPLLNEVRALIDAGRTVIAIKRIRDARGVSLADAVKLAESVAGRPLSAQIRVLPDNTVSIAHPDEPRVHGVSLSDPALAIAVSRLVHGDDLGAVEWVSTAYQLSASEAEEVVHALVGDGPRPTGSCLDQHGRLRLLRPSATGPALRGMTLTMPSRTQAGGVRSVSLDDIDAVFGMLDEERRDTGEDQESPADTLTWMRVELARLDAFESAFLAVNELAPPSDWLRDLKAATHDLDALTALRDRARAERAAQDHAAGQQVALPFNTAHVTPPHHCRTCLHAGAYTCDLLGALRSEALTWRASNTTGDGCPGWELAPPVPFVAPAQPSVAVFDDVRPDWLPEGWTSRLGHYHGPDGEQVFTHGDRHAVAWGSRHADIEAWTDWTERDKRALVLALADPQAVIRGADIVTRAESYLLSDDNVDADPREVAAHDAAMHILHGVGDGPDPRVTMRGELERERTAIAGLAELLEGRVLADGDLTVAQMSCCAYLSQSLVHTPAALNFLEDGWTWVGDDGTAHVLVATVQRVEGKTPGQMVTDLKARVAELEAEVAQLRTAIAIRPMFVCVCGSPLHHNPLDQDRMLPDPACPGCGKSSQSYTMLQPMNAAARVAELETQNTRLQAVLDAELGRKGLPGWTYRVPIGGDMPYWEMRTPDSKGAASVTVGGRRVVLYGSLIPAHRLEGATDALDGMERAEVELVRRGYQPPRDEG